MARFPGLTEADDADAQFHMTKDESAMPPFNPKRRERPPRMTEPYRF
jgi:hypothetical protein